MPAGLPPSARVCLVMMSAIGDAVHTLPVVTALKRHDPSIRLTWILQRGPASLVDGHPDVDEILLFERSQGLKAYADIRRKLEGREFDLVLDLQVYFKASVVTALAKAPVKLGFDRARARDMNWLVTNRRIPPHAPQHVQDQYFEFLRFLDVEAEPVEWKLGPWPHERAAQRKALARFERPLACLAVGSSDPRREWLPERWAEMADRLSVEFGLQPVLIGGRSPRELETERRMRERMKEPLASTLGASLREMVGVIDGAALVLSPNTAPLHIAVALDCPVIGLMAHRNPKRTGPSRFQELMVDAYGEPGEEYAVSMQSRAGGLEKVSVEQVLGKVRLWRERFGENRQPAADADG
jgi:heptosyltransferase I